MKKTLIIGWDAADWKVIHPLIEAGKMPHTAALIERGVMGNLSTLHPVLSPMLWTSIATGKRPQKHGVLGFSEPTPNGFGVQPISQYSRKTKALWNILNQQGLRSSVVGWWPSHPVEPINGAMVSNHYQVAVGPPEQPWPIPPGMIHPPGLAEALAETRINPNELSVEQVLPFVPKAQEIDQEDDPRLGSVMKVLAECASIHGAATWLLQNGEPWDLFAVYYDAIDHFSHGFMKYHPPRREHISERDFELYSGVVEAGYRFHDMMLGVMLDMVPEETTVVICSDHGFHPDHLRPVGIPSEPAGPAIEHRDFGVFIMAGPGLKQDALVHGASLLDITPTLLTHWGMPVGEDMDGKPLLEVFEQPPKVTHIPSWDLVPGDDARLDQALQVDPLAAKEAMDQLVALGYVEAPSGDLREAVDQTSRELKYNLARSFMDADQYLEAIPLLIELYHDDRQQFRFGVQLAMCYRSTGDSAALRELVERLTKDRVEAAETAGKRLQAMRDELLAKQREADPDLADDAPLDFKALDEKTRREWDKQRMLAHFNRYDLDYLMGCVLHDEDQPEQALAHFRRAGQADPSRPGLHIQIGEALLRLRRFDDAEAAYHKALAIDPLNPHAHLGLARSLLPRRRAGEAANQALETIRILYEYPLAHYVLGLALIRLRRMEDAERALQVAVAINPNFLRAHRVLVRLYKFWMPGRGEDLVKHLRLVREIRARQLADAKADLRSPDTALADLAAEPDHPLRRDPGAHQDDADNLLEPTMVSRDRLPGPEAPEAFITVVAGLPRSGTSMLMQMVDAGGRAALTDGKRVADDDNPKGYFEHEGATRLHLRDAEDKHWLDGAEGRVVKVVAQLLPALPRNKHYRILFVERDFDEMLRSQKTMLQRLERGQTKLDDRALSQGSETRKWPIKRFSERASAPLVSEPILKRTFETQLRRIKVWLTQQPNMHVLYLNHRAVIQDPSASAERLRQFLGEDMDGGAMAAVVDGGLYRQRAMT